MRAKLLVIALMASGFSLAGAPQPSAAQSLADVARKEEDRRKTIKEPTKVITNDDLGSVPAVSPPPPTLFAPAVDDPKPADGGTPAADQAAPGAEGQTEAATQAPAADPSKDQAFWAGRVKDLQAQANRNQTFAVALQSRINALTNDYTNETDSSRQASIAAERQRTIGELDRVTKQVEDDKKALADLEEEARRAGVPAGWLR